MRLRRSVLGGLVALGSLLPHLAAQAAPRPQPYCIRGVSLDRAGTHKGTLVLRDGAIEALLDEAAPPPPGTRVIEGAGLICLPAFLDAYSRQGCTVPQPVTNQDLPPNEQADVGIDMRLANRKGIQPAFRAVEALAIGKELSEGWRKSGFGAALVAPGGELLAGSSALASTREAAMRDLVVRDEVFAHGTFAASGGGYPSTFMGYFAQLRQFFLDSQRQLELERRRAEGRPGPRPPFDAALDVGGELVSGKRTLFVEAASSNDIERWLRLGDEFGLRLGFTGAREAWEVGDVLARRGTPVVLTLDWGKEVKDPLAKEAKEQAKRPDGAAAEAAPETAQAEAAVAEPVTEASAKADEPVWEYEEPIAVRMERRRKWVEGRDGALRLHEAGVRFAFGSALEKPSELLARVRKLVTAGLPAEVAEAALTTNAAEFLGVGERLGRVAPGFDATLVLWRADPLLDEKASVAWAFVDGFASEFPEEKKKEKKGDGPSTGIDASGTWTLEFVVEGEGIKEATLRLEMDPEGSLSGTLEVANPMGGARVESEVEGEVAGNELSLTCTLSFGEFQLETKLTGTLEGDSLEGDGSFHGPWSDEPTRQSFRGKRSPK